MNVMRKYLHRCWYRRIWREIDGYLKDKYGLDWYKPSRRKRSNRLFLGIDILRDCLYRSVSSNWWDWSSGSTLYFWRWTD
jgi:hypothetical protein